ncbi:MAG: hypothetical protein ACI9ZH_001666, partial [Paracoccaceae bacterium]
MRRGLDGDAAVLVAAQMPSERRHAIGTGSVAGRGRGRA